MDPVEEALAKVAETDENLSLQLRAVVSAMKEWTLNAITQGHESSDSKPEHQGDGS